MVLSTPIFAADYVISDWSKGLNSHINPYLIKPNQGTILENVRINDSFGTLSKRGLALTSLDFGSTAITGLHRGYTSSDTSMTIISTSTLLRADHSGTAVTIATGLSDAAWWQFVTYNDLVIGGNSVDQPIKYDFHTLTTANTNAARTAGYLCAELGAPFVELATGTTLTAARYYAYKVVFYDGTTYSITSARSNPILTGAAVYSTYLTDIPIGPTGTTHRYIFRTPVHTSMANVLAEADADFLMVKDLADNSTTVWADNVAVGAEPDSPNWATIIATTEDDATPPIAPYLEIHNERLFMAGNTTSPSYLFWSDEYNPDFFDPVDLEKIRPDDGDKITFLKNQIGILVVGKTNSIQNWYTTSTSDTGWYAGNPLTFIGCPAPYSASNSPIGIIYLGRKGLYRFDGRTAHLISDAVTPEMRDISQTNIGKVAGGYHDNQYYLAYTSIDTGSAINDTVVIYDLIRDAYVVDLKSVNNFHTFSGGSDLGTLYSGSSTTDGIVFAHEGSSSVLRVRTQTDFGNGTFDDARYQKYGSDSVNYTDDEPVIELAWDCTIDGWLTELQVKDADIDTIDEIGTEDTSASIIDRPDTTGTWVSAAYEVNANAFDKLYWNETLGSSGNATFQIRTDDNIAMSSASAYSSAVSDPTGSDVSGTTAEEYVQIKASLSTTDIDYTPILTRLGGHVIKLVYTKVGTAYETSIVSKWQTGWTDLGIKGELKRIERIKVFYEGTSGSMIITFRNDEGDITKTFTIDLSINGSDSTDDEYEEADDYKIYTHTVPMNSEDDPSPIGSFWMFSLIESGIVDWTLRKIEVKRVSEESI